MAHHNRTETDLVQGNQVYGQRGMWTGKRPFPEPAAARADIDKYMKKAAPDPRPWAEAARCVGMDEVFLPDDEGYHDPELIVLAQTICESCPVKAECGEWIKDQGNIEYTQGVWGGIDVQSVYQTKRAMAIAKRRALA